jgi:hypothetical protein
MLASPALMGFPILDFGLLVFVVLIGQDNLLSQHLEELHCTITMQYFYVCSPEAFCLAGHFNFAGVLANADRYHGACRPLTSKMQSEQCHVQSSSEPSMIAVVVPIVQHKISVGSSVSILCKPHLQCLRFYAAMRTHIS